MSQFLTRYLHLFNILKSKRYTLSSDEYEKFYDSEEGEKLLDEMDDLWYHHLTREEIEHINSKKEL